MDILQYTFFQNALIAILLMSIVTAFIGTYIVTRRMTFIAGGITHASFGGLGIGYFAGISPTLSAAIFAILSALGIEHLSHRGNIRPDSAIAVFWALGMAIGIIFIYLTPGYTPGLTEFLFGNILTITHTDLITFAAFTFPALLFFIIFYKPILYAAFDGDFARTRGIKVDTINTCMTLLIALAIVLSIQLIGIMLLISVLTLPQIIAENFTHKFSNLILLSGAICLLASLTGLIISTMIAIPTGAGIVVTLAVIYVIAHCIKSMLQPHTSDITQ